MNDTELEDSDEQRNVEADLKWALETLNDRHVSYQLFRDYYAGKHRLLFATDRWQNQFGGVFRKFFDNVSKVVVQSAKDRLAVTGFQANDEDIDDAWTLWENSSMERKAGEVHREALRCGDAYVIVDLDGQGMPRVYPQKADQCCVRYDWENPDEIEVGAKWWALADGRVRVNLYYDDVIMKFVTSSNTQGALPISTSSFQPYDKQPEAPNQWGVCQMFHFGNDADTGETGESELASVIPLQDALNKSVLDMLVAMEFVGFPQRWATGIDIPTEVDPDTDEERPVGSWQPGVDRLWTTATNDAAFGQFPEANLEQLLSVQEKFRTEIARVSRTPLHFLMLEGAAWPSGEALKTSESAFVAKVEDRQLSFGEIWANVMQLMLRMAKTQEIQGLRTRWKPAEPKAEQLFYQNLVLKGQMGVPDTQLQREMGYTEDEIESFQQQKLDEQMAQMQMFNAGMMPGALPPGMHPQNAKPGSVPSQQGPGGPVLHSMPVSPRPIPQTKGVPPAARTGNAVNAKGGKLPSAKASGGSRR